MRRTYKRSRIENRRTTKKRYSKNLSKRRRSIKRKSHIKQRKMIGGTPKWELISTINAIKHDKKENTEFSIYKNINIPTSLEPCSPPNCKQTDDIPLFKIQWIETTGWINKKPITKFIEIQFLPEVHTDDNETTSIMDMYSTKILKFKNNVEYKKFINELNNVVE